MYFKLFYLIIITIFNKMNINMKMFHVKHFKLVNALYLNISLKLYNCDIL